MRELPHGFENYNDILYDIDARFTVKSLKSICSTIGLPISGTKGPLQQRLRTYFEHLVAKQDSIRFNIAKTTTESERGGTYGLISRPANGFRPAGTSSPVTTSPTNTWGMSPLYQNIRLPVYKKMPFYTLLTNVTQAYNLSACPASRTTQPIQLRLTAEMLAKLTPKQSANPYRLVLFCTQTDRVAYGNCVIEFPGHAEIRCNGTIVSANLRGIKNKPGTINPPDLTSQAILIQGVANKVDVTFAESKSAYTLTVYLVEKNTVNGLVDKIRKRGFISKESTLNKMRAAAQDADVVPGPETLTLKDPISMKRIDLPCKSRWCQHTSCFDAATFLTLNEQTPTWSCPICARSISTDDDLFLDGYFYDILQNINKAVESVVIYPDGTWTNKDIDMDHPDAKLLNNFGPIIKTEEPRLSFTTPKPEVVSLDDDDDENGVPTPASLPPQQSRTASTSVRPSPGHTSSRKRGPPQVVDLTLSDDDDDLPPVRNRPVNPPPLKRIRVDTAPSNSQRSTSETMGLSRVSSAFSGVSPAPNSSIRESHIRSPPSSISPRNDTNSNMFRYNRSPATLDGQPPLFRPIQEYTFPTTPTTIPPLNPPFPIIPTITSPIQQSRPHLPSPTISRSYPIPTSNDPEPRSHSASPVLPAFSPPKSRNSSGNNSFMRFPWDSFRDMPNSSGTRGWDADRDDYDNEELDLEMARLPSSMFDADGRQDLDDVY